MKHCLNQLINRNPSKSHNFCQLSNFSSYFQIENVTLHRKIEFRLLNLGNAPIGCKHSQVLLNGVRNLSTSKLKFTDSSKKNVSIKFIHKTH